jgi:hypothetical protein
MPDASKKPTPPEREEWQDLAEKASKEQDPNQLMKLVNELCKKIDEREAALRKPPTAAKP